MSDEPWKLFGYTEKANVGMRLILEVYGITFWNMNPHIGDNPLRAKFSRGNINIYLHFMSLLHNDMTHVLKILPQVRPGPTYSI